MKQAHVHVRPSRLYDIYDIEANMRPADLLEVKTAFGDDRKPSEVLQDGFKYSDLCWSGVVDGRAAAMFGVVPLEHKYKNAGSIWLLGTTELDKCVPYFIRHSKDWLSRLTKTYDIVGNAVHSENTLHLRWLDWLGFDFGINQNIFGEVLHPFLLATKRTDV